MNCRTLSEVVLPNIFSTKAKAQKVAFPDELKLQLF
jgi:hypothetical protein